MDTDQTPTTPRPARRRRRNEAAQAEAAKADYLGAVLREATRLAAKRFGLFEADDIAQRVVEKVVGKVEATMVDYPDPIDFARRATANAGKDHLRRERVQHGGDVANTCEEVPWKHVDLGEIDRTRGWAADPAEIALGQVGADAILGSIEDPAGREYLAQAGLLGLGPVDLATVHGVHHSTAGRRLRTVRKAAESRLDADGYVRAS